MPDRSDDSDGDYGSHDADVPGSAKNPIVSGFHLPYAIARYALNCQNDGRTIKRTALRQDLLLGRQVDLKTGIARARKILRDDFGFDLKKVNIGSEEAFVVVSVLPPELQRLAAAPIRAQEAEVPGLAGLCCILIVFHGGPVTIAQIAEGLAVPFNENGSRITPELTENIATAVRNRFLSETVVSSDGSARRVEYSIGPRSYASFTKESLLRVVLRTFLPSGGDSARRERDKAEIVAIFEKTSFESSQ